MATISDAELIAARSTIVGAVRAAGLIQLRMADATRAELKGEGDVVTEADRRCESQVVDLVRRAHPGHAVLAEEGGGSRTTAGPLWILDPLDGTKNYVHRVPRFACSLALVWNGEAILGAVYNPVLDELFVAEQGAGATLNGEAIHVSGTSELAGAMVSSAFTVGGRCEARQFARLERLARSTQALRVGGCASLDLCDVARGRLDAYFEEGLEPWDSAAGALMVREAGGNVTDFQGRRHDLFGRETLASNGRVGGWLAEKICEASSA